MALRTANSAQSSETRINSQKVGGSCGLLVRCVMIVVIFVQNGKNAENRMLIVQGNTYFSRNFCFYFFFPFFVLFTFLSFFLANTKILGE